ncbi:MAG: TetR-like C-terminal domain-containing protein [Dorea sp.]
MKTFWQKHFLKSTSGQSFLKNDPDIKYPYAFILNGCVGLIRTWLSSPQSESPEQVARLTISSD